MKKKGIDVSKYQGRIDWPAVKRDGVEFAMIRAGYGMYPHQKDPFFDQNVRGAQAAGIHVGAYHYSYAKNVDDTRREAELFLSWLSPLTLDYPAAFDIEDNSQIGLSPELLTSITETFCDRIAAAGYLPMVYANKYWLQNKLIDSRISRYELWLAHYVTATDYDKPHGIWQCTSRAQIPAETAISTGATRTMPPAPHRRTPPPSSRGAECAAPTASMSTISRPWATTPCCACSTPATKSRCLRGTLRGPWSARASITGMSARTTFRQIRPAGRLQPPPASQTACGCAPSLTYPTAPTASGCSTPATQSRFSNTGESGSL